MVLDPIGFLLFAAAMIGSPGPANMVMLSVGAKFGLRGALPFVLGVVLGKQLIIWPIGFGLMALATSVPIVFSLLKWASVSYIFWLAWRIANSRIKKSDQDKPPSFWVGLMAHPLNPKAWALVTVAFTSFVIADASTLVTTFQVALGLMIVQLVLHPLWTLGGQAIAATVAGKPAEKYLMWLLAGLTVASVLLVLLKDAGHA